MTSTQPSLEPISPADGRSEYARDWGIYTRWLRGYNQAMKDWLTGINLGLPETEKDIPVIMSTPQRAFAAIVRPLAESQVDIPAISFTMTGLSPEASRSKPAFLQAQRIKIGDKWQIHHRAQAWMINYNVTVWTQHMDDLDYVSYALLSRFTPKSYVNVSGIASELTFIGHSDNSELEPGADKDRVLRHDYQFKIDAWMQMPYNEVGSVKQIWMIMNNDLDHPTVDEVLADPTVVPQDVNIVTGDFLPLATDEVNNSPRQLPGVYTEPETEM
jgi:hypothetical protein